jgi:hypothetical protein
MGVDDLHVRKGVSGKWGGKILRMINFDKNNNFHVKKCEELHSIKRIKLKS